MLVSPRVGASIRRRHHSFTAAALVIVGLAATQPPSAAVGQEPGGRLRLPSSPTGQAVMLLVEMIERGDDSYTTEMLESRFTDSFRDAFPMDQHLGIFRQLHDEFAPADLGALERTGPNEAGFTLLSTSGASVAVAMELEPETGKISGLEFSDEDAEESSSAPGSFASADELRSELQRLAAANEFSGVVLVANGGRPTFLEAVGLARKSTGTPVRTDTRFNIGSLTKAFTGSVVLQLVAEGKLGLDDPIGRHLEGFSVEASEKVTVRHLILHRSGWGAYWDDPGFLQNVSTLRELSQYMEFLRDSPLGFEPGAQQQYSNTGYEVLGAIIESVTGQSYHDVVQQKIFDPLGMEGTCSCDFDASLENVATGYTNEHPDGPDEGYVRENTHLLAPSGSAAGGTLSTVEDLMRFYRALYDGRVVEDQYWGLLFGEGDSGTPRQNAIGLAGGGPGVQAFIAYDPGKDRFTVVLSNFDSPAGRDLYRSITRSESL